MRKSKSRISLKVLGIDYKIIQGIYYILYTIELLTACVECAKIKKCSNALFLGAD